MFNWIFNNFADNRNKNSRSYKFRKKRFEFFLKELNVKHENTILDVGGSEQIWIGSGFEKNVTLLNIEFKYYSKPFKYIKCDATDMSVIPDKSYDIVFSNSVIEHVGNEKRQRAFANEIERVAKTYWIQTPNKYFPIEPHFVFPFFQFLPQKIKTIVALKWKFSHFKINNDTSEKLILLELSKIKLLSLSEIKELFPGSRIIKEKYFGLRKSLIVVKK